MSAAAGDHADDVRCNTSDSPRDVLDKRNPLFYIRSSAASRSIGHTRYSAAAFLRVPDPHPRPAAPGALHRTRSGNRLSGSSDLQTDTSIHRKRAGRII